MIKRTPPNTPTSSNPTSDRLLGICQSGSAPNLSELDNVTHRSSKRKHGDDYENIMQEMRSLITKHSERCDSYNNKNSTSMESLQSMMAEVLKQNREIKDSISFVSQQYEDMKTAVGMMEDQRKKDRECIAQLEERVDYLERMQYINKIEIKNVPTQATINEEELRRIVLNTAQVVGSSLQHSQIKDIYHIRKKDASSSRVVAELSSVALKEDILNKTRKYNTDNKSHKLCTTHLNLDGPPHPIYVAECLPPRAQHIFFLARKFAAQHKYKYCWTSSGRIFLRKSENEMKKIITCEEDLKNLEPKI